MDEGQEGAALPSVATDHVRRKTSELFQRLDDGREILRRQASAADQRAVDIRDLKDLGAVLGLHRAAIEDTHSLADTGAEAAL